GNDDVADVAEAVRQGSADAGLQFYSAEPGQPPKCNIVYQSDSINGRAVRRFIEDRFRAVNEDFAAQMLARQQPPVVMPLLVKALALPNQPGTTNTPFSLATLIPLILILMTVTGAVYPAIDLTAGERERGTLEALVAAPVPRHELLFAKYIAVLSVAMLTAVANLLSMVVTAYASGLEGLLFGSSGLSIRVIASTLGLLCVFAAFFSAVILVLTSFARSFKEAQAYLIPVMLVALAPGVMCLLPGIEFNGTYAVTPLVNIVLLTRDVFENRVVPLWALATLLSTVLYSAVALGAAARIFGTDAVLYGSDGGWVDLFRRPDEPRATPTLAQAMFGLAVLFPAFLILSSIPARWESLSIAERLMGNAAITLLLFAGLPLALTAATRVSWTTGLSLRRASFGAFAACAILGLSLWPFAYELQVLLLSPERLAALEELFAPFKAQLDAIPLWLKLLALAAIPAVCEELFFRGFLLSAFRTSMSNPLAVAFSGVLFGLFHVIVQQSLFSERFVPTCFLGVVLAAICVRTGSVLPGMLLHVMHNGFLLSLSNFTEELKALGIGVEEHQHLPALWLAIASVMVAAAFGLLVRTVPPAPDDSVASP
ncbi:MAG: CPBP family intramembrane metalloprotease, partial [Candidatus Saccharimonas sp.]|nr:CPBP family intramembrane metalloprotease [Planctomycetaceae bacterium]